MAESSQITGCISCGACVFIVILSIFLSSVGTVEPVEYGVIYNKIDKTIDKSKVYPGGWYYIGFFNEFYVFPKNLVNMDFSNYKGSNRRPIRLKDKGGQIIELSFSLQYNLIKDDIVKLYDQYQMNYEEKFESFIDQAVRETVGTFNSTMFWKYRRSSGDQLKSAVKKSLNSHYADIKSFQILDVQLTSQRETTLIKTQVEKQIGKTKEKERQAKETRSEISVKKSQAQATVTEIEGSANAQAKNIVAKAKVEAAQKVIDATSDAYAQLSTKLQITPDQGLDEYIYYSELQNSESTDLLYNIKKALIRMD